MLINKALRYLRIFHDINQKTLAQKLKLSRSFISEIESGKKSPTIELLGKYSELFNVPISSICFLAEALNNPDQIFPTLSPKVKSMLELVQEREEKSRE